MSTHILRNPDRDGEVGEGSVSFTLTKPVDPVLLDAELTEKMGWDADGGLVIEGDVTAASEGSPVVAWVLRDDVDSATLRSVVAKHKVPYQPIGHPLLHLRDKAEAGEDLIDAEVQQVLRYLILRATK